jgi:hypothetical protein
MVAVICGAALAFVVVAAPASAEVTVPSPPFIGGVLSLDSGVSVSSAAPAWQAINTGTGNAFEAYAATAGKGITLQLGSVGVSSATTFLGGLFSLRSSSGYLEAFSDRSDAFQGGGIQFGGSDGINSGGIWWDKFANTMFLQSTGYWRFFRSNGVRSVDVFVVDSPTSSSTTHITRQAMYRVVAPAQDGTTPAFVWDDNGARAIHTKWVVGTGGAAAIQLMRLDVSGGSVPSLVPASDNAGNLGSNANRWASIRAVTVTTGDLGFEDECCPVCGACFNTGEDVVWRIRRQKREGDGKTVSFAVPVHVGCSK